MVVVVLSAGLTLGDFVWRFDCGFGVLVVCSCGFASFVLCYRFVR